MRLRRDGWYDADKGKHFVLTEKGKAEVATFRNMTVGEPTSDYDTQAVHWSVESGYEIEVNIPDWIVTIGYKVVYDHNGYEISAGNTMIFPERILAEKYMRHHKNGVYHDCDLYITETTYEGRALKPCREHNGKQVYNMSWYYGCDTLEVGDLVEQEIVDDIINCIMPACMRSDCVQLGEPSSHKEDENGNYKVTYATFKRVAEGIWEYCGDCFRGENVAA